MFLMDTHCHLYDKQFNDDFDDVINRAFENNVKLMIIPASDLETSFLASELASKYKEVYFCAGIHPHDSEKAFVDDLKTIESLLAKEKAVAIGEIGLDYHYNFSPRDVQIRTLENQLFLAKKLNLPIVVHSRECFDDLSKILKSSDYGNGVIHCFSGDREEAKFYLDLGFYLGFTGNITFKNAEDIREAVKYAPLDRILTETDSPYLAPIPKRGRRNEPSFIPFIANKLAELKNVSVEEVTEKTTENAFRLFKKIKNGK